MRILEVRDGFIKFETKEAITLASFIEASETEKRYIAQIVKLKKTGEYTIGFAKILYLYDGLFNPTNGSSPSVVAELKHFSYELINKSFDAVSTIAIGYINGENSPVRIAKDVFDKNLLVSINSAKTINNLVENLISQFSQNGKIVVLDTLGILDCKKSQAGVDFRLPLNTESLTFMYEDCLSDATSDSKNLTKDIFQELGEYSKTVPFLPFSALKSIVDDMVEKQHIFKLLVLKNKLAKFDKLGYFASTVEDAKNIEALLNSNNAVIDLSKLDPIFLNRYLNVIYSTIKVFAEKPQVIILASNAINKKALKPILTEQDISSNLIINSRFRYLNEIKTMFKNFIIEPNFANNETFKAYNMLLSQMPKDTCLLVGNCTNFIPLVVNIEKLYLEENVENLENSIIEKTSNKVEISVEDTEGTEIEPLDITPVEKDEQTVAIERKSEGLIDRLTEEVETTEPSELVNLFGEEDVAEETNTEGNSTTETESPATNTEIILDDNSEDLTLSHPTTFFTEVHSVITEETLSEDNVTTQNEEISEVANIENLSNTNSETISNKIETTIEEDGVIEIDLPDEISNLTENEILIDDNETIKTNLENSTVINEQEFSTDDTETTTNELVELEDIVTEELLIENETSLDVIPLDNNQLEEVIEISEEDFEDENTVLVDIDTEDELEESNLESISVQEDDSDNILAKVLDEQMQNDELDREIAQDVDKVFTTMKEVHEDDEVSDLDLDLIDELNNEKIETDIIEEFNANGSIEELSADFSNELEETDGDFLEPIEELGTSDFEDEEPSEILQTKNTSTPIVPVYDADIPQEDTVMSDPIEQGDSVVHAKYGNGIVEKMINYGTKTLYSINFENIGRRLLDPTLTEIKKG